MSKGDPIGTPVNREPWPVGTWVWLITTKKGPWVVLEDDPQRDIVYVDSKANRPATVQDLRQVGYDRKKINLGHRHVDHYYRTMLTDVEPPKGPHWTTRVDWEKFGTAFGTGAFITLVIAFFIFVLWRELGAPHY